MTALRYNNILYSNFEPIWLDGRSKLKKEERICKLLEICIHFSLQQDIKKVEIKLDTLV